MAGFQGLDGLLRGQPHVGEGRTRAGSPQVRLPRLPARPGLFRPFPDGSGFLLWDDPARAAEEIGKINARDGRAYLEYNRELGDLADLVRPLLYRRPPDPGVRSLADVVEALSLGRYAFGNRRSISRLVDLMTMSCADFLDRFFVDERIKGALAPGASSACGAAR